MIDKYLMYFKSVDCVRSAYNLEMFFMFFGAGKGIVRESEKSEG